MKLPLFSLMLICCCSAFSQNSYLLTKSGTRHEIAKNTIQVVVADRIVAFKTLTGSNKEIGFDDVDVAIFGSFKFKNFKFKENRSKNCYFVLAESPKQSLVCLGIPDSSSDDEVSARIKYELYVLDAQNQAVDFLSFDNNKNEKSGKARSQIHDFIRRNFGECTDLMDRLADFDKLNEPQYMGLLGFFKQPNFKNCQ